MATRRTEGGVPAAKSACGQGPCFRSRVCLRAGTVFPRPSLPAGRDFGPVRTCGAFPPAAARQAPRSRSHGRLRRPKSLPIRHSSAAVPYITTFGCRDIQGKGSGAAVIANSWAEIGNRCKVMPVYDLLRAAILDFSG